MKKLNPIIIVSFLLLCLFTNCSAEEQFDFDEKSLIGVWYEDFTIENIDQISRLEYRFNSDSTYEVLRIRINNSSGEILGYRYRELGDFSLRGNRLFFTDIKRYTNDDTAQEEFSEIENLQPLNPDFNVDISEKIEFRDNLRILAFVPPPCPPNASCAKPPLLKKK